jgi:hypothetical protein
MTKHAANSGGVKNYERELRNVTLLKSFVPPVSKGKDKSI